MLERVYRINYSVIILLVLAMAGYSTVGLAQDCLQVQSTPTNATVTLKSSVKTSGVSPCLFCTLVPEQRYLLRLGKPGYETRELRLSFSPENQQVELFSKRFGSLVRSLLIPGWGQLANGEYLLGVETMLGSAAIGTVWYGAYTDYIDERDRYRFFKSAASNATTEADFIRYSELQWRSSRLTNAQRRHMLEVAALGGWMYVGNLVETFLVSASPRVASVEGPNITLEIPRRSKARAVTRSFFFPGMGQKYLGKHVRGLMYQTLFVTAAVLTLDARRDYDTATIEYELASEALARAETQPEVEAARELVAARWEERRDEETKRNAYYIILASLWFLNVLDTSLSRSDVAAAGQNFGFDTSFRPSEVHAGIRISF
ncbi:MAG: PEGA domain-containing protein [Candidatus Latescibacteria bacterium]|nr:PEGA domain-containing protein [Candidatus Latescibacterota bacterium]NIM21482.1 PEGA domain-containing protein [Candidatus Latescibacterota bacterium]NIM65653.1 PEGA domain-containing protein [Candidatus Latescibacterota bacterium]NIO02035.1 PEGA domain-containing protein [Candidatus Latescibacterota bacterium]NIO28847.1 PEGA domain-containing protein [Candidatus Latescibacterota bacterium]